MYRSLSEERTIPNQNYQIKIVVVQRNVITPTRLRPPFHSKVKTVT